MEKIDRRVKRTHRFIAEALITLAQEKGYDAVSIRDITDRADISYSTFFRHYPDKDSLLLSLLENVIIELREMIGDQQSTNEGGTILFRHVAEQQSLYRALLGGLNSSAIVQRVQDAIAAAYLREFLDQGSGIPKEIAANHVAASSLALVKWWLDNDTPYPPERMGEIYQTLVLRPVV